MLTAIANAIGLDSARVAARNVYYAAVRKLYAVFTKSDELIAAYLKRLQTLIHELRADNDSTEPTQSKSPSEPPPLET
jgi:hypothetical protein